MCAAIFLVPPTRDSCDFKGQWQQNFLLSILKVLLHLTMNMILIPVSNTFVQELYACYFTVNLYFSNSLIIHEQIHQSKTHISSRA